MAEAGLTRSCPALLLSTIIMAPPFLPLATSLLFAAQAGATKPPAPIVVPASVPLAAMCNDPDVHCIL